MQAPHKAPPAAQPARSELKTVSPLQRMIAMATPQLPRPQLGLRPHQAEGAQVVVRGADAGGARPDQRRS